MVSTYINYFRQLAVGHKDIKHDQLAEGNQGDPERKKFTTWGADEAITGLKTSVGFTALFLEMFELVTRGDNPFGVRGSYKGAISIFDRVAMDDFADQSNKAQTCYRILEEILRQIWQDHYGKDKNRCSTPFAKFNFNELDINYVGPLFDNVYGWRCEFSFEPLHTLNLQKAPEGVFELKVES